MTVLKRNAPVVLGALMILAYCVNSVAADALVEFYPSQLGTFQNASNRTWQTYNPPTTGALCNPTGGSSYINCIGNFQLNLSQAGVLTMRLTVPPGQEMQISPGTSPSGVAIEFSFTALITSAGGTCENFQTFNGTAITTDIKGSDVGGLAFKPSWYPGSGGSIIYSTVSMDSCKLSAYIGFDGPARTYMVSELGWNVTFQPPVAGLQTYRYESQRSFWFLWGLSGSMKVVGGTSTTTAGNTGATSAAPCLFLSGLVWITSAAAFAMGSLLVG